MIIHLTSREVNPHLSLSAGVPESSDHVQIVVVVMMISRGSVEEVSKTFKIILTAFEREMEQRDQSRLWCASGERQ